MKPLNLRAFRLLRSLGLWHVYRRWFSVASALMLAFSTSSVFAYDAVFAADFEIVADAPASDAEAARFLSMATFGPTQAEISHLRSIGYSAWINEQWSRPATLERPSVQALDGDTHLQNPGQTDRLSAWMKTSLTAPDQLRQRVAWELSQIFVVTFGQSMLGGDPVALAEYYDTLARDADGTYSTLLYDVTLSPAMGKMLTYQRNKKPDHILGTLPDENYAREVMQLFSIGLVLRHADFSPIYPTGCIPDAPDCQPIQTYPQATVGAYAQVFTGWSYVSGFNDNPTRRHWAASDYQPMKCYDQYHDEEDTKTLLSYTGNYASPSDAYVLPAFNGCEDDLSQGLEIIAHHPNVAPFISRQLIQRLVTSNPTPAYIARVSAVFNNNGHGVYGDLGAVIKAVLLDTEARYNAPPPPAPYVFGKVREPLLKLTALYRYYNAVPADGVFSMTVGAFDNYAQTPLGAPSVFNFYLPDYHPPGELGTAGLYAPEFQITNESSAFSVANDLRARAGSYYGNPNNTAATIAPDLRPLQALAGNPAALVAQLNHDLMYDGMSPHMQSVLTTMVGSLPADPMTRVVTALQVVLASPEFAIQK
jgi:uncharacterized protein (DUF1800 family)